MKDQEYTKFGPLYINWYLLLVIQLQEPITLWNLTWNGTYIEHGNGRDYILMFLSYTKETKKKVVAAYIRVDYKIPTSWLFQKYWAFVVIMNYIIEI